MSYSCKEIKSSLIKQIVLLYDFILLFFQMNAEYEVRISLYELPEKYGDALRATWEMERLIENSQNDILLNLLGIVRIEMKIWKKLWEKWGGDTTFITWGKPFFLPSKNPDTWGPSKEVRGLMDDIEIGKCLHCGSKIDESSQCHECENLIIKNFRTCHLINNALIRHLGNLYTFITDNDLSISAHTFQNRCKHPNHPWHEAKECSLGNLTILLPRVKEYIRSYPDGFATLDTISNQKMRKDIIENLEEKFPDLNIDKIESNKI